jgi:hypothetical protein
MIRPPPWTSILNVAGSRESRVPGFQEAAFVLMVDVLIQVNPTCNDF